MSTQDHNLQDSFSQKYPSISDWLIEGTIEFGCGEYGPDSFVKVCDEGGLVWEGKTKYKTLDEALQDTENAIKNWYKENT